MYCEFDWEILYKFFQTIVTLAVALGVYYLWHRQKGKEVIANEAKDVFKMLENASKQAFENFELISIMASQAQVPKEFDKERLLDFRDLNLDILKKLDFIKFKNRSKKTLLLITKFELLYADYIHHYFDDHLNWLEEMNRTKQAYIQAIYELRKEMYEYALYRKII